MALLGIDVGFSTSRPTTGIAWSKAVAFMAAKTHTDWPRRSQHIPASTTFLVIAIDGPLVHWARMTVSIDYASGCSSAAPFSPDASLCSLRRGREIRGHRR
ncbi:hypothetical protein [Sinorhizobium fredii]|uniref:hypothetical protein n=1 Tax=Rhizobium fredii TaxID=380 RepID=UPI0004ACC318|nr:hypothetical protein [Sinorhizobium fredii]